MQTAAILGALHILHAPPSTDPHLVQRAEAERGKADQQLKDFQTTQEAWGAAMALLQDAQSGPEARMFAAQTLRTKIMYDLGQLDDAGMHHLKACLLELAFPASGAGDAGGRAVARHVVLALADLAAVWTEWADPVAEVLGRGGATGSAASLLALEFVRELPIELFENRYLHLSRAEADARAAAILDPQAARVVELVGARLAAAGSDDSQLEPLLRATRAWLQAGAVSVTWFARGGRAAGILEQSLHCLVHGAALEEASELVCEVIRRSCRRKSAGNDEADDEVQLKAHEGEAAAFTPVPEHSAHGEFCSYCLPLVEAVVERLAELQGPLLRALMDEDEETMRELGAVFVEAGQTFHFYVLERPEAFAAILDALLRLLGAPSLETAVLALPFWETLTETLAALPRARGGDNVRARFAATYAGLVDVILAQCAYPSERMSATERDEFREFRHDIGHVLKLCVSVLGPAAALRLVEARLEAAMPASEQPGERWQKAEAAIFALRVMGSRVPPAENDVLPQLMRRLLAHEPREPKLRYAVTLFVGRYAEWTRVHADEFLAPQLTFVCNGLAGGAGETRAAAAMSLKYLCESCRGRLVEYLPQLSAVYRATLGDLQRDERRDVAQGLAHVVGAVEPARLLGELQQFALPIGQHLAQLAAAADPGSAGTAAALIDQLAVLLRYVQTEAPDVDDTGNVAGPRAVAAPSSGGAVHPCVLLLGDLVPLLEQMCIVPAFGESDPAIVEAVCRVLRNATRNFAPSLALQAATIPKSVLAALCQWVAARLARVRTRLCDAGERFVALSPSSSSQERRVHVAEFAAAPLWLAQALVTAFLTDGATSPAADLVWTLVENAASAMDAVVARCAADGALGDASYALLDFFGLLRQTAAQCPRAAAVHSPQACLAAPCAAAGAVLVASPNVQVAEAVLVYLEAALRVAVDAGPGSPAATALVSGASALVTALGRGLFETLPRESLSLVAPVLVALAGPALLGPPATAAALHDHVLVQIPADGLFPAERDHLLRDLASGSVSCRTLRDLAIRVRRRLMVSERRSR